MRLIKSPLIFVMMTSSCGLGFAYDASCGDVGAKHAQVSGSFSTVCSGYGRGQSSTHSRFVCDVPGIRKLWLETSIEL